MAINRARQLRNHPTDAEAALWRLLRNKQLCGFRFRRQAAIGNYIVDFACFSPRLVIEIDGGQHAETAQQKHDQRRTAWLESEGFRVLRYWNNDVLQNIEGTIAEILLVLEQLSSD